MYRLCLTAATLFAAAIVPAPPDAPEPVKPVAPPATPAPDPAAVPAFGVAEFDGIPFIKIPAGTFRQGTTESEQRDLQKRGQWLARNADEMPARPVQISRSFFLSRYEVRQKDWAGIMGDQNPSAFKDPNRPVESVSWNEAEAFCRALSQKSHATYRLPTEAEWEYAARAGSDGPYGSTDTKTPVTPETLKQFAVMNGNAPNKTQPVGTLKPNAWGLYDTLGNVWEWCRDAYTPNAYRDTKPTDPVMKSTPAATERVFRGGCWYLDVRAQRIALRAGNLPGFKSPYVGFRIVRETP